MPVKNGVVALFDIDGTLVRTEGASPHSRAFKAAFQKVFGTECNFAVGMHGMTDLQIFMLLAKDVASANGALRESAIEACRSMVEIYQVKDAGDGSYVVLPGVRDLLSTLRDAGVSLGLITGNVPEIARDKLEITGLDGYFGFGAFGTEGDERTVLPPLAVARAEAALGVRVDPSRVFVIGDTPRDVAAALDNGYRAVAVATGHISVADLSSTGAELVLPDLSRAQPLLALMGLAVPS
ncbi:MAG TPA: HAD family hydrolase [Chloroflexota bacterium]